MKKKSMCNSTRASVLRWCTLGVMTLSVPLQTVAQTIPTTVPTTAPATQPARNGAGGVTSEPGGGMVLNFKDATIDAVLDELSSAAGFIVVKEVKPEGRVTLVSKQSLNAEEVVSLLNTVLRNAGYVAIRQERILKIVNKDAAKRLNIAVRTGSDPDKIAMTDELITQVIPLRYADATQLKTDLTPLINPEADFTANASSNALVITDTSANVRRVVQIVAALDAHLIDAVDVKVFQLQYAGASSVAKLINDVFANQDQFTGPGGQTGAQQPGGRGEAGRDAGGPGGGFERFRQFITSQQPQGKTGSKVNASPDDRTNTVVVTGPVDALETVGRVIKELDSNPTADETVFVYRLKNAQSLNVEATMNLLFNGTNGSTSGRTTASLSGARSTPTNASQRNSSGGGGFGTQSSGGRTGNTGAFGATTGAFGANTGTFGAPTGTTNNNRRAAATPALPAGAQQTAVELAGQVSIIADPDTNSILVRTSPKNYEQVKTILNELDRAVQQVLIKVLIAEVTHTEGQDLGAEFSALNLRAGGNGQTAGSDFGLGAASGGLVVNILETNFSATLRALETTGKLDVLSRPYILASDNQLASITVGQEVPIIQNSRITDTGQTINTLQYTDVGILLDVIPHINPEGLVILDVAPEISQLTGESVPISDTASQPIIAKRSARSRVAVKSGQTVVIGGLMEDRRTETVSKIPLLGDLPGVGALFRRSIKSKTKTELLIFLTPQVAALPDRLPEMGREELEGTKLVPNAVEPGLFQEHMNGLQRGAERPATMPVE